MRNISRMNYPLIPWKMRMKVSHPLLLVGDSCSTNALTEDDEEVDYENDVVYEPELEGLLNDMRQVLTQLQSFDVGAEDDDDEQEMGWGWDAPPPPAIIRGHHHHHHRHGLEMFGMVGGESFRGMFKTISVFPSPRVHANMHKLLGSALTALHQILVAKKMEPILYYSVMAVTIQTTFVNEKA